MLEVHPLVTNMGYQKNPWEDVPLEVIIEYERKKKEQLRDHREYLRLPIAPPIYYPTAPPIEDEKKPDEDYKIVINFI